MIGSSRFEHVLYEARRVAQTPRSFSNWPTLLGQLAGERFGRGSKELTFLTRDGVRLSCPNVPGARLAIYEQFSDDCYRLPELLASLPAEPARVLDVGSHVGSFAVNVARSRLDAIVDCYEPSPQSAGFLRRNIDQNSLAGRIQVHEAALAGTEGVAILDDNEGASVHNGLMADDRRLVDGMDALATRRSVEVRTTTFDAAVAAAQEPPNLVKMDCEGGEYEAVYASSRNSWASVFCVVMEYHPVPGESWSDLSRWFADAGLDVLRHKPAAPGLGTAWLGRRSVLKGS